jgi:transglutaminase-like putative cysteine protease
MRVSITHSTRIDYTSDVLEGVMDVRLGPLSDADQQWQCFELQASPNASVGRYSDGFFNAAHLVTFKRPHRYVEVTAHGEVETLLEDPFVPPRHQPKPLTAAERVFYLQPSRMVPLDARLNAMAEPHHAHAHHDTFEAVQQLMGLVYGEFVYEQRVTDVTTAVSDVLNVQRGVCQDFAHVLIGLCRAIEVPARYVSGYVVSTSRGSQESHAWMEAFTPWHGWRGFDPTNNLVASTRHIKAAIGRDYRDVAPTRGAYRGMTDETLAVQVNAHALD